MCSVCVIKKFYVGVDPSRGDPVHNFLIFFTQTLPCACRVCVPISVANGQRTWPPNANTHTQTDRQTDRQFELYIVDCTLCEHPIKFGESLVESYFGQTLCPANLFFLILSTAPCRVTLGACIIDSLLETWNEAVCCDFNLKYILE